MTEKTHTLVIERIFDAPVEKVWRAWSDAEEMKKWHGPRGFTAPAVNMDFRVGGKYHSCMRSAEGQDFWSTGIYKEIIPLKKIVCSDSFADPDGNVVPATYYGMPEGNFPLEMQITALFEDLGGQTKLTLYHEGMPKAVDEMSGNGWNECLDKLAESVK